MNDALIQEIAHRIQVAQRILVVSHIRPDGDAVGSLVGLGLALREAGKDIQMVLTDGVPASFRHLEGSKQVRNRPEGRFDFICTVDCSDLNRTGGALNGYPQPDLNIDHHITNLEYARINLVEPSAVATAEMLAELLPAVKLPLNQPVSAALLTGIITDTIGFRTSNVTPKALRIAADLMELGANLPEIYRRGLVDRSFEAIQLWGAGLENLNREGGLVWTTLTLADRRAIGYPGRDDADLINVLSSIEDADIAVIFVEQPKNKVKVSWRAQPGIDVSLVALSFGGGGHPSASGAEIEGRLDEVRSAVIQATHALLNGKIAQE